LLTSWAAQVAREGRWQPSCYEGYQPVTVDVTAFWRPRLHDRPTRHYSAAPTPAGRPWKALPAIPIGIIGRIGRVGSQRLGVLVRLVRADQSDPSPGAHRRALLRAPTPAGRPSLVRPLARRRGSREFPATPADQITSWEEDRQIRAEQWTDLVLPDALANAPSFSVIAIFDPKYHDPLLLATHGQPAAAGALSPRATRDMYKDRWPVEQLHGCFASVRPSR